MFNFGAESGGSDIAKLIPKSGFHPLNEHINSLNSQRLTHWLAATNNIKNLNGEAANLNRFRWLKLAHPIGL